MHVDHYMRLHSCMRSVDIAILLELAIRLGAVNATVACMSQFRNQI